MRRYGMVYAWLVAAAVLLAGWCPAAAKELERFVVRGYVTVADTSAWVVLDSVYVSLALENDTTVVPFKMLRGNDAEKMADEEVRLLVNSGRGSYMLTLERDGYEPLIKDFKVTSVGQDVVWLGSMAMRRERHRTLSELTVTATAIKMVMKGDTIVYNADAFNLAEGSMLDALVRQLPGAELSADGRITVNGRFVNSLLVNGKDFFKGDPKVALQNLPAYTVKNVKVYDKAADDDYLTRSSAKLARREDEENLVMDVVLKREFSMGLMGSVEAGYGTEGRYLGKVFGMTYSDKFRMAAFANVNNLNDDATGQVWGNGGFSSASSNVGGVSANRIAGLTYNYDDSKRWEAYGEVQFTHADETELQQSASTRFYPGSADLYGRSDSDSRTLVRSLTTRHHVFYRGDNIMLMITPSLSWDNSHTSSATRSAQFTEPPVEESRMACLDSVFAPVKSERYHSTLLSRLATASVSRPDRLNVVVNAGGTLSPSGMRGRFRLYGRYDMTRSHSLSNVLQHQRFGGANTSGAMPVDQGRYSDRLAREQAATARLAFSQDWKRFGTKWCDAVGISATTWYTYNYADNDSRQFTSPDGASTSGLLPSLSRPTDYLISAQNSADSRSTSHRGAMSVAFSLSREPITPVDSGFNPRVDIELTATGYTLHRELLYDGIVSERIMQHDNYIEPGMRAMFRSGDARRYWAVNLMYRSQPQLVSPNLLLSVRNNIDPLNVYVNNADGLRRGMSHSLSLFLSTYDRSDRQLHGSIRGDFLLTRNSIGQAAVYNEQTGVTVYTPRNINGNWTLHTGGDVNVALGRGKHVELKLAPGFNLANSVDFITLHTTPERSVVKTATINAPITVAYKFDGGHVRLTGETEWQRSRSDRADFTPINAVNHYVKADVMAKLPWQMEVSTTLNVEMRRGYDLDAMNTTQWLWDASLSKSVLKGRLLFKLSAIDILGQMKRYSVRVNAQGRYENWNNSLPRYALLTVSYRFTHTPPRKP